MKPSLHFPAKVLAALHTDQILGIRVGTKSIHCVIDVWVIVVDGMEMMAV